MSNAVAAGLNGIPGIQKLVCRPVSRRPPGALTMRFDDPHTLAPPDMGGDDARAWEEKIAELVRDALVAPTPTSLRQARTVELRGARPDTELIIGYVEGSERRAGAVRYWLWRAQDLIDLYTGKVDSPASVASAILSRWAEGGLEPVQPK